MAERMKNRQYGYLTPETNGVVIRGLPGQQVGGYGIGIVYIENVDYPFLPGNVVNACTYDYPVRMMPVKNLTNDRLFNADPTIVNDIIEAAQHMVEADGVRAICSACGFFGNYQKQVAEAIDVPVAMSSLVQLPWIKALLKPGEKVGILTASAASVSDQLFINCGISDYSDVVVRGIDDTEEMSTVVTMKGTMDNAVAREELLAVAEDMVTEYEDIGAILLECSDMPPYAADIQRLTQRPVFDFITLINWLHNAVCQTPYAGWL